MDNIPAPRTWVYFCPVCEETEHWPLPVYNRWHSHDIPSGTVNIKLKLVAKTYDHGVTKLEEADGNAGN